MKTQESEDWGLYLNFPQVTNKPDAVNLAVALRFAIEDQWRRATDLER